MAIVKGGKPKLCPIDPVFRQVFKCRIFYLFMFTSEEWIKVTNKTYKNSDLRCLKQNSQFQNSPKQSTGCLNGRKQTPTINQNVENSALGLFKGNLEGKACKLYNNMAVQIAASFSSFKLLHKLAKKMMSCLFYSFLREEGGIQCQKLGSVAVQSPTLSDHPQFVGEQVPGSLSG